MKTDIIRADDALAVTTAAACITAGDLVAIPTETVYGLGANGLNPDAVAKIFEAKGRPQDNPLILHIADAKDMEKFCHSIPKAAWLLAEKFWPGPLTMVLPARDCVPKCTTAGLPTVAVRCPDCAVTRDIIRKAGVPVAAPSANISGKPSTTTAEHVFHDHNGKIPLIVDDGPCRVGVESTIVDLTEDRPRLLRPGGITEEQLRQILSDIVIDKAVTQSVEKDTVVKAPGMKYRHYAPACKVLIVDGDLPAAVGYVKQHFQPGNRVLCFTEELEAFAPFAPLAYGKKADPDTLLAGLFAALRQLDDPAIGTVFARCPRGTGKALAVQNRLGKAAGFCSVNPRKENYVIGITGGTGSGKTTALHIIRELGGQIIDCDEVYHRLLENDSALLSAIEARFPGTVVDGILQRRELAKRVFQDPAGLSALNAITHPAVKAAVMDMLPPVPGLVAIDAIELFDGGLAQLCDTTVGIIAPEADRVARLMQRDNLTEELALMRIRAQKPEQYFREKCDYILENNGTQADFREKCLAFFQNLLII